MGVRKLITSVENVGKLFIMFDCGDSVTVQMTL